MLESNLVKSTMLVGRLGVGVFVIHSLLFIILCIFRFGIMYYCYSFLSSFILRQTTTTPVTNHYFLSIDVFCGFSRPGPGSSLAPGLSPEGRMPSGTVPSPYIHIHTYLYKANIYTYLPIYIYNTSLSLSLYIYIYISNNIYIYIHICMLFSVQPNPVLEGTHGSFLIRRRRGRPGVVFTACDF